MTVDEITRLAGLPSVDRVIVAPDGTVTVVTRTCPPAPPMDPFPFGPCTPTIPDLIGPGLWPDKLFPIGDLPTWGSPGYPVYGDTNG